MIIIDPPWDNRSVRRKKWYSIYICAFQCFIFINPLAMKLHFLRVIVFEQITRNGKPVHPYNIDYKLPFENLLIACAQNSDIGYEVPKKKVIISVPCAISSRKPPLNDILSSYLRHPCRTLELFARGLLPNTTSIGNQAVAFQSSFHESRNI
ncbi:MT-A70 domain containing protein [Trichuris trichiura]|uniref:MT-A70 domain containing protein n=1 Tax=Trichuris trichiura TaxID=36087 RepID=A0A077Z9E5_TRITR|nr:MT-A70 domain containing protein [Trichuris trichiura]